MKFADLCNDPLSLLGFKALAFGNFFFYSFTHIITINVSICTIDFIYVDSPITILKDKATNRLITPRINFKVYMYEPNASENMHVMVSLICPYVLDIKVGSSSEVCVIQKILLLKK